MKVIILQMDDISKISASQKLLPWKPHWLKVSRKLENLRDPYKNYNKMTAGKSKCPMTPSSFKWNEFATAFGLKNVDTMIVGQPEFVSSISKILCMQFPNWMFGKIISNFI